MDGTGPIHGGRPHQLSALNSRPLSTERNVQAGRTAAPERKQETAESVKEARRERRHDEGADETHLKRPSQ